MTDSSEPQGMVDHLDSTGSEPAPAQIEFIEACLEPGPLDPALLALAFDPARVAEREAAAAEQRVRDWANLGRYRSANGMLGGGAIEAVFMGDSITEFWALAEPDFFSAGIVGRGIGGQTSAQMLVRFMPDVIALKPKVVHLLCGGNDLAGNTGPSTPRDYQNNVLAMVTLAQANGVKVILGSITPASHFAWAPHIGDPRRRLAQLNAWLECLAEERGLIWADYHSALRAADDSLPAQLSPDGVHPNRDGYALMGPVARAALAIALD